MVPALGQPGVVLSFMGSALDKWNWIEKLLASEMNMPAKLVAVRMATKYINTSGRAWPSIGTLAGDLHISRNSVIRGLKELTEKKVLRAEHRYKKGKDNDTTVYQLISSNGRSAKFALGSARKELGVVPERDEGSATERHKSSIESTNKNPVGRGKKPPVPKESMDKVRETYVGLYQTTYGEDPLWDYRKDGAISSRLIKLVGEEKVCRAIGAMFADEYYVEKGICNMGSLSNGMNKFIANSSGKKARPTSNALKCVVCTEPITGSANKRDGGLICSKCEREEYKQKVLREQAKARGVKNRDKDVDNLIGGIL